MNKIYLDKVAILGTSKKFITTIKSKYNYKLLKIFPWRRIKDNKIKKKIYFDYIFVCGFDFSLYYRNFNLFCNQNINEPLKFLKKISYKKTKIIYINTLSDQEKYTLSRYKYAKQNLAYYIQKNFKYSIIINTDLITIDNKISVFSSAITKIIFRLLIIFGFLRAIEINNLIIIINKLMSKKNEKKQKKIYGLFLNLPRTQFIDRILRFFFK